MREAPLVAFLLVLAVSPALAEPGGDAASPQSDALILEVRTEKTKVYLHEPVPLTVTLLAGQATPRNIEYPRLGGTGFALGEFSPPRQRSIVRDGRDLVAYEFTATLTPKRSGTIRLGPAELRCDLSAPADGPAAFFGATEPRRVTLRSEVVPLTVLPLPAGGRPAGFSGAVGNFALSVSARPTHVHKGDPVTVTMTVRGKGNLTAASSPKLEAANFRTYPAKVTKKETFMQSEQVIVPAVAGAAVVPAVAFSFFDPDEERYVTLWSKPIPLEIESEGDNPRQQGETTTASTPPARTEGVSGTDRERRLFIAPAVMSAGALLLGAGLFAAYRLKKMPRGIAGAEIPDTERDLELYLAEAATALADDNADAFYTAVFRALQKYVGRKCQAPAAGTTVRSVEGTLLVRGLEQETLKSISQLFSECDQIRYGRGRRDGSRMKENYDTLKNIIADR